MYVYGSAPKTNMFIYEPVTIILNTGICFSVIYMRDLVIKSMRL